MAMGAGSREVEVQEPELPESIDLDLLKDIMIFRALGWSQSDIADELDTSQQTVSRYLTKIRSQSQDHDNPRSVFYGIFLAVLTNIIQDKVFSD